MCSPNNTKRGVKIQIEEESIYSTPGKTQSAPLETESSEEFHLARDHFSTSCVEDPISDSVQSLLNQAIVIESDSHDDECKIFENEKCTCNKAKTKAKVTSQRTEEATTRSAMKQTTPVKPQPIRRPCAAAKPRQEVKLKTTTDSTTQTQVKESACRQNIDINISEIKPVMSSGVINIPIHLQVSIKQPTSIASARLDTVEASSPQQSRPVVDKTRSTNKYVFQMCSNMAYVEPYMDEILDDPNVVSCKEIMSTPFLKEKINLLFNTHCSDDYVEPYVKVGYSESQEVVKSKKDRRALNSTPSSVASSDDDFFTNDSDSIIDLTKDNGSHIQWQEVILQPRDTIKIAQVKCREEEAEERCDLASDSKPSPNGEVAKEAPKKKKKGGFFGCCGSSDDDDDDGPVVSQSPVTKLSLVYGKHCLDPEPYTLALLREYPHEKMSDSPCTSNPEIPWPTLILREQIKIRTMDKAEVKKITEEQVKSASVPCVCPSAQNKVTPKPIVPSGRSSVTFTDHSLVTLYPPPAARVPSNLPVITSKSSSLKQQLSREKAPVGIIKARLSGKSVSDDGVMRTKVTLSGKDLNEFLKSGKLKSTVKINDSPSQKLSAKETCTTVSKIKTLPSRTKPTLEQVTCASSFCPANAQRSAAGIQVPSVKQDPVLTAFIACEAELKPVKQALNQVQQKLRNMNMPELDSIFSRGTELANQFLNKRNKDVYRSNIVSGFGITTVNRATTNGTNEPVRRFYPPSVPSYPASYASPSTSTTYMQYKPRPYTKPETYQYAAAPSYRAHYSSSPSTVSLYAPYTNKISTRPNYDMNYQCSLETNYSNSSFGRSNSDVRHVSYNRDQNENSRNRPGRCCCGSSNYGSDRRPRSRKSDDESSVSSTSLRSEGSACEMDRNSRRMKQRAVRKSRHSEMQLQESLCPFLQVMKSILSSDTKKITKKDATGISYDSRMSTKKIKNMRVHMRVRTSKKRKLK